MEVGTYLLYPVARPSRWFCGSTACRQKRCCRKLHVWHGTYPTAAQLRSLWARPSQACLPAFPHACLLQRRVPRWPCRPLPPAPQRGSQGHLHLCARLQARPLLLVLQERCLPDVYRCAVKMGRGGGATGCVTGLADAHGLPCTAVLAVLSSPASAHVRCHMVQHLLRCLSAPCPLPACSPCRPARGGVPQQAVPGRGLCCFGAHVQEPHPEWPGCPLLLLLW